MDEFLCQVERLGVEYDIVRCFEIEMDFRNLVDDVVTEVTDGHILYGQHNVVAAFVVCLRKLKQCNNIL